MVVSQSKKKKNFVFMFFRALYSYAGNSQQGNKTVVSEREKICGHSLSFCSLTEFPDHVCFS